MKILKRKSLYASAGLILTQAIWGFGFIAFKIGIRGIHPVTLVAYEFTLSAIILGIYFAVRKRSLLQNYKAGLVLGLIMWAGYITHSIGLALIPATDSAFIASLNIVLVPVIGFFLFKTKISAQNLAAVIIAFVGVWVLTGGIRGFGLGDMLTLGTALFVALHILFTDKYVNLGINPYILNFQQLAVVGVLSFIAVAVFRFPLKVGNSSVILALFYLTLFADTLAYGIQSVSQKYTIPIRVAIIFMLEPVFTAVFVWLLNFEPLTTATLVGGTLIIIGLFISEIPLLKFMRLDRQRI